MLSILSHSNHSDKVCELNIFSIGHVKFEAPISRHAVAFENYLPQNPPPYLTKYIIRVTLNTKFDTLWLSPVNFQSARSILTNYT